MKFIETLNYRPLTVIGLIASLQTFLYGFGYILPTSGFEQTVLYIEMANLLPHDVAGALFILTGLLMAYSLLSQNDKLVTRTFQFDAFVWLFAFFVYCLHGTPVLGLAIAGVFSLAAGYIGYAFPRRKDVALFNALE